MSPNTKPKKSPLREALEKAPVDDEPYTDDERAADAEALSEAEAGGGVSSEELRRRLQI